MAERGWTVPDWPKDYGGGGLSAAETAVLKEEMARIGARTPLASFGISMLGPALLMFGTEEQKTHYLPQIARGEIRWCQGYSEPGAGSDLAGLQTKAEDKGDHWLVNGQKVWTSYADKADWIFCLVRTSTESKQGGISFLLFDMETPGVTTKPILLISGNSPFCETFFDDVKVPRDQVVGEVNKGWDVAKYLLGHEREMISGMGLAGGGSLGAAVKPADPLLRAEIAAFDVDSARVPGDERAVHRDVEGRRGASGDGIDDEICRDRAQQAPQRAGDGGGRVGRAGVGRRRGQSARATGCGARAIRSRAGRARSSSGSSPSIFCGCLVPELSSLPLRREVGERGSERSGSMPDRALFRAPPLSPLGFAELALSRKGRGTDRSVSLLLTDDQKMLQETAASFLAEEGGDRQAAAPLARHRLQRRLRDRAVEAVRRAWADRHLHSRERTAAWDSARPRRRWCSKRSGAI